MADAAPTAKPPTVDSTELYTVNESTDTVRGQLENYTDLESPLDEADSQ